MFRTMDIKEVTGVKDHGLIRLKGECSRCLGLGEISDRAWVGILIFDTCSYFSDKLQGTSYKISLGRTHTHTEQENLLKLHLLASQTNFKTSETVTGSQTFVF